MKYAIVLLAVLLSTQAPVAEEEWSPELCDAETLEKVLDKALDLLTDDGFISIGAADSILLYDYGGDITITAKGGGANPTINFETIRPELLKQNELRALVSKLEKQKKAVEKRIAAIDWLEAMKKVCASELR